MSCMSRNRLIRWPASSTALVATVSRPWPTKRIRRLRRLSRFKSMNTTSTSAIARLPSDSITGLSKPGNRDSQGGLSASTTTVGGFSGHVSGRRVHGPSLGALRLRLPFAGNVLDHLFQTFHDRPLAHLPERSDLFLDILGVLGQLVGYAPDLDGEQPDDPAQEQCRQQHDHGHRRRSPQVPPLEETDEREPAGRPGTPPARPG